MPKPKKTRPATIEALLRRISSTASAIIGESISIPAGAAGTIKNFNFAVAPIANAAGNDLGSVGDTSIALTSTAFTTEVLPKADADLANGEYYVDYLTGKARGKKADTSTSGSANYSVFSIMTNITGNEAVKITDGTDEADVEASGADAVSNTRGSLSTSSRMSLFNGTTWDRARSGVTTPTSTFTGFQNGLPWAVYHTTPTARTNGQGGPLEADAAGSVLMRETYQDGAFDNVIGVVKNEYRGASNYISSATTTTVKSGAGHLHSITIGETAAGSITVYDNTAGSGTVLAVLKSSIAEGTYTLDVTFATGLTIVTAAASKATVSYR